MAKSGVSGVLGDGTAWVVGRNSECAHVEGHEL